MNALAPYIFLKSIELLDVCFEVFGANAGEMSFTHPIATERARKMRGAIEYYLGRGKSLPLYANALLAIDRVFHWFLVGCILNLQRLKSQGRTPRARIRLTVAEHDERMEAQWNLKDEE